MESREDYRSHDCDGGLDYSSSIYTQSARTSPSALSLALWPQARLPLFRALFLGQVTMASLLAPSSVSYTQDGYFNCWLNWPEIFNIWLNAGIVHLMKLPHLFYVLIPQQMCALFIKSCSLEGVRFPPTAGIHSHPPIIWHGLAEGKLE